jgi:hypothetical protein
VQYCWVRVKLGSMAIDRPIAAAFRPRLMKVKILEKARATQELYMKKVLGVFASTMLSPSALIACSVTHASLGLVLVD